MDVFLKSMNYEVRGVFHFLSRALKSGSVSPGLVVYSSPKQRESKKYKDAVLVALLGAMEAVYVVKQLCPNDTLKLFLKFFFLN